MTLRVGCPINMTMPKIKNKITAQFVAKLGKTPITINLPIDLASASIDSFDDFVNGLDEQAVEQLQNLANDAKMALKNKGDVKRAFKAFAKAHPSDEAHA